MPRCGDGCCPAGSLSAGSTHACVLTLQGQALCWGDNLFGQLGRDDREPSRSPAPIPGLGPAGITQISAGHHFTCAVVAGAAKCWGWNSHGKLGDGTTENRSRPVGVQGLGRGTRRIVAGMAHACAIDEGGGLWCWGYNASGQLGDGTNQNRPAPVAVAGLSTGVSAVALGLYHTCALVRGRVMCWGSNATGQVGAGEMSDPAWTPRAVDASTASSATSVAAGGYSSAYIAGGALYLWGDDSDGQLGDGATSVRARPAPLVGLEGVVSNFAFAGRYGSPPSGEVHACAVVGGGAKCWGSNIAGQVGNGIADVVQATPADVVGLSSGVATVATGAEYSCALTLSGGVLCWGSNDDGQLGDGGFESRLTPGVISN